MPSPRLSTPKDTEVYGTWFLGACLDTGHGFFLLSHTQQGDRAETLRQMTSTEAGSECLAMGPGEVTSQLVPLFLHLSDHRPSSSGHVRSGWVLDMDGSK